jgi:hypothetical protein
MNPNVIYTIEDPEIKEAIAHEIPRKMRREYEYENRIRNKSGNIYDLLDNN